MEIDWEKVKEWTLWNFEDLIKRVSKTLEYPLVREHYNHTMKRAEAFASGLLTYGDCKHREYLAKITSSIRDLSDVGIDNYIDLIESIRTRVLCEGFLAGTKIHFRELIRFLNYLFRWVLPFNAPVRELLDKDNETHLLYAKKLKGLGIKNTLDVLEHAHTRSGLADISNQTGISESFLFELVNRADISRLPYIRGKTVDIFYNAGYDSLQIIAKADLDEFVDALTKYLLSVGVKFSKSFIEPDGAIAQAKVLPPLVSYLL